MPVFVQAKSDFDLRLEPRMASPFVVPTVTIVITDQLEVIGEDVVEKLGAVSIGWARVKSAKGEGFADRSLLQDFVAPPPVSEEQLPIEFRRTLELPQLATLCYRNALRSGTNSAILLALAHAATGEAWTATLAQPRIGERLGIYGFLQAEWDAALVGVGSEVDVKSDHITLARAQCEIAGVMLGRAWKDIAAAGKPVRAIDLYLAFLSSSAAAIKLASAADADTLSAMLGAVEAEALAARAAAVAGGAVSAATTRGALVTILAAKFEQSLAFVRSFADGLVADNVPAPIDVVEQTEQELDHQDPDPEPGEDGPIGPGIGIVVPEIKPPPIDQPSDGTLIVSEAHLVGLWKRALFPIDGRGIIVFGIRGCLPVDPVGSMDFAAQHRVKPVAVDYRRMRCTIGQWRPGKGFALFPGSTVPFFDLVDSAARKGGMGVNQMGRGRYRNYTPGWHKRSEGKGGHWALLQASDINFQRTAGDVNYTPSDPWDAGQPGDNIHCAFHVGSAANPAEAVYSSAGCQVVAGTVKKGKKKSEAGPWQTFIAPFLKNKPQGGVEYVLFDGSELRDMVQTGMAGRTVVLRMGSEDPLVGKLQSKLGLSGPDDKFGRNTFRAVIKFQHEKLGRGSDDGTVGPETAEKLGLKLPKFDFAQAIARVDIAPSREVAVDTGAGAAAAVMVGGQTDPKFAALLELVSRKESGGNYNAFFGKGKNKDNPQFTAMTVKEVRKWQRDFVKGGSPSSAVGRYQIISKTMGAIVGRLGLDGSELFDESLQDRMAIDLLNVRQLGRFLSGKIGVTAFGNQLAMEWASLPVLSAIKGQKRNVTRGESFYAGDGLNKAHVDPGDVEAALKRLIA